MTPSSLILVGVLTPTAGISGALLWPVLQRRYQWSNLRILVTLVIMASLVPAYGCLGFLSIMQGRGGLTTPVELLVLAVYFGSSTYFTFTLVFAQHTFRICVWCVSELCKGILRRVASTWGRSEVVRFHLSKYSSVSADGTVGMVSSRSLTR
jgi:hypothetical protein